MTILIIYSIILTGYSINIIVYIMHTVYENPCSQHHLYIYNHLLDWRFSKMDQTILNLKVNSEKILQETTVIRKELNTLKMALNDVNHQVDDFCKFIETL